MTTRRAETRRRATYGRVYELVISSEARKKIATSKITRAWTFWLALGVLARNWTFWLELPTFLAGAWTFWLTLDVSARTRTFPLVLHCFGSHLDKTKMDTERISTFTSSKIFSLFFQELFLLMLSFLFVLNQDYFSKIL